MKKLIIILFIISSFLVAQEIDTVTYKICINAGHGGHTSNDRPPGTPAGYWESEGNLTRALALETIFKNYSIVDVNDTTRAKFSVIMTRRHNRHSDNLYLSSICQIANSNNSDWMQSIHSNATGLTASTRHTTLLLYPGPTGDSRINGLAGYPKCPAEMALASIMATNISKALQTTGTSLAGDWSFYGTGRPYLGVFRTLQVPGTLSEGTFHDYYPETYRLQNLDFRINESWAIALSFFDQFNLPEPEMANLAGIIRTYEEKVNYPYGTGSNDQYKPVDSIKITIYPVDSPDSSRIYNGNTTMYADKYAPQWSQITSGSPISSTNWATIDNSSDYDYYMNGYNNNHNYNRNNGFYLFDSLAYGSYVVIYEAPGFWPDTGSVTIDDSKFFWTKNRFMVSSVPPYVKTNTPKANEVEHPAWEPIILGFSHAMDTAAVRNGLILDPSADLIYTWNSTQKQLSLSFVGDSLEVETDYTLTLSADSIKGNREQHLDGNADGIGGDDFVLNFTTSPMDIYAPEISVWFPSKYARHADLQPILSFTYDELIDASVDHKDKFRFYRTTGDDIEIPFEYEVYTVNGQSIISLFPTQELERSTSYMRIVNKGISDLFGNTTTANLTSGLIINSTIPYYADTLVIDAFSPSTLSGSWKQPGFSGTTKNLIAGSASANSSYVNHCNNSSYSMAISYTFDPVAETGFLREYLDVNSTPASRKFTNASVMQAWVFADGSNNKFRFAVDDPSGTGSHEVSPWFTLDYIGWRLLKWDLRAGINGTWEGVSDGTLDGQLNFDSFQIEYIDSLGSNEGVIYIEDLVVMTPGGVAISESDVPAEFSLEQNYPNPFNPTTAINYQLSEYSNVNLSVYDIHGRRVATLINEAQSAGTYSVDFHAGPLPSGVYIARLQTEMGAINRKMLLVK
ncbi:MAG: Ig-like domain-containing protein [Candidatus Marinimicrobia bacterium]|nr:Ig-like domain-containing protein [Candidatus Neomarinimicrobiota bacterium]